MFIGIRRLMGDMTYARQHKMFNGGYDVVCQHKTINGGYDISLSV